MEIQTLSMDPRIAAIHYKDYRKKVREHRDERLAAAQKKIQEGGKVFRAGRAEIATIEKEDTILMESYRMMAKGQRIVNLASVMKGCGLDAKKKLPLFAVARADWKHAHLQTEHNLVSFTKESWARWSYNLNRYNDPAISFMSAGFPAELLNSAWRSTNNLPAAPRQRALVPAIPVHLRPAGDLSKYTILWEAQWEQTAPEDPILLRHVAGHMYSVVAQWDLTPIEQSVLEGRIG